MKKFFFYIGALFILFNFSSCGYNSMVEKQEAVEAAWGQVENVYQRRADLIPNLVATVKGAADFEKSTLEAVIKARDYASDIKLDPDKLTPENIQKFENAQNSLSGALGRFLSVVEQYPELKANQNFRDLQAQLEGTENRISVERRNFNLAVQDYNTYIRKFPNNMTAGMFGFEKKGYFQSKPGSDVAPTVKF